MKWKWNKKKFHFIFFFFLVKETYVAIETWKYENTIQICTVLALLSTKRKIVIFRKNNIFYKSNNLFLIKMYNLKKILINFDDLIIRYHLIKFYSAVLILFLIEIKNFTYKFHLYLFIISGNLFFRNIYCSHSLTIFLYQNPLNILLNQLSCIERLKL